jgi:hypothetical protein
MAITRIDKRDRIAAPVLTDQMTWDDEQKRQRDAANRRDGKWQGGALRIAGH